MEETQDLTGIKDMYDVEILVGVELVNKRTRYDTKNGISINEPAYFDMINHHVIAEAGWLKEDDLRNRLERLSNSGYLCHHKTKENSEESWFITRKGLGVIKYG